MGDDFDWTNPEFWTDWDKNPPVTDYGWDDAMQDLAESGGLKPSDFAAPDFLQKAVDALKKLGGKAADFVSSPQGIMSLVGAAANYVDRQRPSGGGTTMAYQGPAELKRKMVQGPYGPVAEYEGVGGGAPDYTRFAAPTVREPAPAPEEPDYAELLNIVRGLVPKETAAPATAPKTTAPIAAPGQKPAAGLDEQPFDYNKNYGIPFDMRYRRDEAGDEEGFTRIPIGDLAQEPIFQILESASPQAKAQEYNRLRNAGFTNAQIREQAGFVFGPQSDEDWQYLKNLAGETAATATAKKPTGEVADQDTWNKNAAFATRGTKNRQQPLAIWRDPVSGNGIAVIPNDIGVPAELMYIDSTGTGLNSTAFNAADLYKSAEKLGMDLSNIGQLGAQLDAKRVGYKPYELYKGTGSDHGIDFQDIAQGGLGTAYDWTKDPLVHLKGPTAQTNLAENQALARRLGVNKNVATTTEQGIDPARFTTLMAGSEPRSNVAFTGGTASWYDTPQQAQNYLTKTGVRGQVYDTSSGAPTVIPAAQPAAQPPSPRDLKSLLPSDWGSITDPSKKIDWFNQQKATEAELRAAGVKPEEIAWMRQNKLGTYAQGGPVRMEDGGFVMTKRAVDGAGGPRGIQQLVPGATMIRGPGHGTSDSIPAYIQGRNGRTPARLSNGEAYVPPGRDTDKLYALMKSLERNA